MNLGQQLNQTLKILLTVLGLQSTYPPVDIYQIAVTKNNGQTLAEFKTRNLLNEDILSLAQRGITLEVCFRVTTRVNQKIVFSHEYSDYLRYYQKKWLLNDKIIATGHAADCLSQKTLLILPESTRYPSSPAYTEVEVLLRGEGAPDLRALWGNRPWLSLHYSTP